MSQCIKYRRIIKMEKLNRHELIVLCYIYLLYIFFNELKRDIDNDQYRQHLKVLTPLYLMKF